MAQIETLKFEGTPAQLATFLEELPEDRRYRLVEVEERDRSAEPTSALADPNAAASIALLKLWIAEAPTEPDAIREAEEELREFQNNINLPRKEAGARLLYSETET